MSAFLKALAEVESAGRLDAIRFEPHVYQSRTHATPSALSRCRKANACSVDTARMICAASWGRFQVMGFNLYGLPLIDVSIARFLISEADQNAAVLGFFGKNRVAVPAAEALLNDRTALERIARLYNGSGNVPAYSAKLRAALIRATQ